MKKYKEIKREVRKHHAEMAEQKPIDRAWWWFWRRPYQINELSKQARRLIRVQGQQILHKGSG